MAITMKFTGMEEISAMLDQLGDQANFVASFALYEGAGVMADSINAAARAIVTEPFRYAGPGQTRLPSPEEKAILLENGSMGIARFDKNGSEVNTSVGYNKSGYADVSWNHMNSAARTNYKAVSFKGKENTASSTLRFIRRSGKAEQYGLSSSMGHGAQNRKPVGVIANAINSGTSFMKKQPFFRIGANNGRRKAEEVIRATVERLFNQIINNNGAGRKSA